MKKKVKRRFILVDTENVQNRWFELLRGLRQKDKIIVFYTENHSKKLQDYLEVSKGGKRLRWVECISGENALDYQLLGVLSYLIYIHPKAEYIIYSNDKGYQETVRIWEERGIRIKLAGFSTEKVKSQEESFGRESQDSLITWDSQQADESSFSAEGRQAGFGQWGGSAANTPGNGKLSQNGSKNTEGTKKKKKKKKKKQKEQKNIPGISACVWEIGKSLPFEEKAAYHTLLVDFLGPEEGREQYYRIRESEECQELLRECYLDNPGQRVTALVQAILQRHSLDASYGKAVCQILKDSDLDDLQAVKRSFDDEIGTRGEEQRYYSVLKKYFSLLKKMLAASSF